MQTELSITKPNDKPLSTDGKTHGNQSLTNLINDNKINWGGHKFQENSHLPVPKLKRNSSDHFDATRLKEKYLTLLQPCTTDEIAQEIYKLQGHYWQQGMPADLMREVAKDYARLLAGYSLPILQRACDDWKISPEKFCPKLGELKEKMDALKAKTEIKIKRLTELLDNLED